MELTLGDWQLSLHRQPHSQTALAAMYDAHARGWHAQVASFGYLAAYRQLFAQLAAEHRLDGFDTTTRVLDCGIGSGALSLALAETVGAHFQLDGVDIAPGMLADAAVRLRAAGLTAMLHEQRIEELPFADASFDAVICAHVVEHTPNIGAAFREMQRVLRPGAPMILVISRPGPLTALLQLRWHATAYAPSAVLAAMGDAGLTGLQFCHFDGGLPRYRSYAYLGFKHVDTTG